jgi:hypothetical protein
MHRAGRRLKLVTIAALVMVPIACSGSSKASTAAPKIPKVFNFIASTRLNGAQNVRGDLTSCVGVGDFADVRPGALVTVADLSGKVLATSRVGVGLGTDLYQGVIDQCSFGFNVANVPGQKAWLVTVGKDHTVTVHRSSVIATDGRIDYSLNGELVTPTTVPQHP